jgi:transposase
LVERVGVARGAASGLGVVYAARFTHLNKREQNKLTATQAQAVIAAAILRQLHAVITTGQRWDPIIATHSTNHPAVMPIAA